MWVLGQQLQVLRNQVRYVHRLAFEPMGLCHFLLCMGFGMIVPHVATSIAIPI